MKAKIEAAFVKEFKPFDLVITFESADEAMSALMKLAKLNGVLYEAYDVLDDHMTENNLKTD